MKPKKLITPDDIECAWWLNYPCISGSRFTLENSGNWQMIPSFSVSGYSGHDITPCRGWRVVGYTMHPQWEKRPDSFENGSVAILFEKTNGETAWFHFPK